MMIVWNIIDCIDDPMEFIKVGLMMILWNIIDCIDDPMEFINVVLIIVWNLSRLD